MPVDEQEEKTEQKGYSMWVCPRCGKTVHIDRRYCECHADLYGAKVRVSDDPPEVDRCNFETEGLHCGDCPENCTWCASFGIGVINSAGFGGEDCRYKSETVRCYCCQAQVRLAVEIEKGGFWGFVKDALKKKNSGTQNIYSASSEYMHSRIIEPVLARIRHAREKAG